MKSRKGKRRLSRILLSISIASLVYSPNLIAGGFLQEWFQNRLFAPTEQQRTQEQDGKVVIYDGIHDVDVNRAMDTQFHRIEHMMFIGTVITNQNGEPAKDEATGQVLKEDDDC